MLLKKERLEGNEVSGTDLIARQELATRPIFSATR